MSTKADLLRGSIVRTLELGVLLAASFVMTPLLVRALGDRQFGFWSLVGTVVGYYGFLELGLTASASRHLARAAGRGDARELDEVASTSYHLFGAAALAVVAVAALTAWACPLFVRDAQEAALVRRSIAIMGVAAAVGFPSRTYAGLMRAAMRHDALAAISIARTVLFAGSAWPALESGGGLVAIALASAGASLFQYAATVAAAKAAFPGVRVAAERFDRARMRGMLDYGATMFVCQLGDILRGRVDTLVVAGFLGAGLVTPYAVGVRLVDGFTQLVGSSVGMMLPVFSRYEGSGDFDSIRAALMKVTRLGSVLSAFVGLSVMFYGGPFVERWMGPGYDAGARVAAILSGAMLLALPMSPGIQLLYGLSRHKEYAVLSVGEGLLNAALSALLVSRLGLVGVALGTLLATALVRVALLPRLVCRAAGLPAREYMLDGMLLPILKTAVALGAYFWLVGGFVSADYAALAGCAALQAALFAPAAYYFIFDRPERDALVGALRESAPRRARLWMASARD